MRISMLILCIAIAGCINTARRMNDVSVGMTKKDVIGALGDPDETRAQEGTEFMMYELRKAPGAVAQTGCGVAGVYTLGLAYLFKDCRFSDDDYFVQLRDGRVTSYGRFGDFGTVATPQTTINLNQRVETVPVAAPAAAPAPPPQLAP